MSWTAASGATSYKLERGPSSTGPWTEFTGVSSPYPQSGLAVNTTYWYRVRGTNTGGDGPYSTEASATTLPATTAVADGSVVPNATMCPSYAATPVNAFTLSATGAADTVTRVTVSLSPPLAYLNLSSVQVTNDAGTVTYGSGVPANGSAVVSLGAGITAPVGSATQYKVRLVPKLHADMLAPNLGGDAYATTALVTEIVGTNPAPSYGDATSGTVTVDNRSPANPRWGTVTVPGSVSLSWTNPTDADVAQVVILRNTVPITDLPVEGTTYSTGKIGASDIVYVGAATPPGSAGSRTDAPANGIYYYKLFAKDGCGNYSTGADLGPLSVGGTVAEGDPTSEHDEGDAVDRESGQVHDGGRHLQGAGAGVLPERAEHHGVGPAAQHQRREHLLAHARVHSQHDTSGRRRTGDCSRPP